VHRLKRLNTVSILAAAAILFGWQSIASPTRGHTEEADSAHAPTPIPVASKAPPPLPRSRPVPAAALPKHPNIVFILSDDQRADTLPAMPSVRSLLADRGIDFTNAVVSNSLCCRHGPRS
jgi:pyruvate/2-oxoglutarate dehydrogenase complex dihydrolipoamide acyltransferase (E2) component